MYSFTIAPAQPDMPALRAAALALLDASPGDMLAPELADAIEYIGVGDYVHVTPHYMKKPYFAWVKAVNVEAGRVVVEHWSFGYIHDYSFEEVRLVLKKDAAEIEMAASR